jgi:hypothetical protein
MNAHKPAARLADHIDGALRADDIRDHDLGAFQPRELRRVPRRYLGRRWSQSPNVLEALSCGVPLAATAYSAAIPRASSLISFCSIRRA